MGVELNIYSIPRLVVFVLAFSVGLFALLKNKKSKINRSFFILALSLSLRDFAYLIVSHITDISFVIPWSKFAYCGVVFIPPATYHFIISFLNLKRKKLVRLFYIFSVVSLLFIVRSDHFFTGARKFFWGYYPQVNFTMHNIFLCLWIIPVSLTLIELYKRYKETESPFNKKRIKYFLITFPIAYLGTVDYLPSYGVEMYPFGLIPVIFFIVSTTYNINRYRLLDLEIIIKRLSLITLGFMVSMGLVYTGTFWIGPYLSSLLGENWIIFPVSVSFLASLGLFWFINFVRHIEENELSRKFAYRPLLRKEAQRISVVRNIKELLIYITRDLTSLVRLDYVGIFIWNIPKKRFVLEKSLTRSKKRKKIVSGIALSRDNALVRELCKRRRPLVRSKIEYQLASKEIPFDQKEPLINVIREMRKLGAEISVPSVCEGEVLAVINIGQKLNASEIITDEDLEIFFSLSNHIARAIYSFMLKEEKVHLIVASQNILISAIEAKDRYTRGHTDRVARYSALVGDKLERDLRIFSNGLSELNLAAQLHDVGKISIPDSILLKPGPLDKKEWAKIKEHPINGIKIIGPFQEWLGEDICSGILHHHENYDGSGYPDGQKEEDIHLFSRIIRVVDAFDAMLSERPFSPALSREKAMEEIRRYKGIYFDPLVVEATEDLYNIGKI
ncbi:HD domain-containing phosphohydrolase [Candidatus Omnitrophota bacterium]